MDYESFNSLPESTKEALLAGYSLPELELYKVSKKLRTHSYHADVVSDIFNERISNSIEILKDGLDLNHAICMVFSADTMRELANDTQYYNDLADRLNSKYGEIVYKIEDNGYKLGLVGYRKSQFTHIMTTTYSNDGFKREASTTVSYPYAELKVEDEQIRNHS